MEDITKSNDEASIAYVISRLILWRGSLLISFKGWFTTWFYVIGNKSFSQLLRLH